MSALSIKHISQMLDNPQSVTIDQAGKIKALKERYPYFAPAQHLEAAVLQNVQPFSAAVLNIMHNSNTNWMLLYNYLEQIAPVPTGVAKDIATGETQGSGVTVEMRNESEINRHISEEDDIMAELRKPLHTGLGNEGSAGTANPTTFRDEFNDDADVELPEFSEDIVSHGLAVEPEDATETLTETAQEDDEIASLPLNLFGEEHVQAENFEETIETIDTILPGETSEPEIAQQPAEEEPTVKTKDPLIQPIYTEDYFLHEGVEISNELPEPEELIPQQQDDSQQSLMVMRSFVEWLSYFKTKSKEQQEEEEDKKALKTMLQKQKLAAAIEEENEEIPEQVFEMAVNSITQEDGLASESLADIYVKQGKYDKAIDMYRKLSLRNPQKNTYFARKIEEILKEKQS
jgi:tetratricopeptide (TPR) repeat protein